MGAAPTDAAAASGATLVPKSRYGCAAACLEFSGTERSTHLLTAAHAASILDQARSRLGVHSSETADAESGGALVRITDAHVAPTTTRSAPKP